MYIAEVSRDDAPAHALLSRLFRYICALALRQELELVPVVLNYVF